MKPPSFAYHRPGSVREAVETLAALGPDAKVLAGGQSLVPLLNMRLAAPKALVDINRLNELSTIEANGPVVRVGALSRHAALTRPGPHTVLPLLEQATRHVAHGTIRNRGTTVGSIVHADPAGELPAVLLLCDGTMELASTAGTRQVPAAEFFLGPLESAVRPGELAVAARFAVPSPSGGRTGRAWVEVSRRAGDYALCGLGLRLRLDGDDRVTEARAAYISVGPTPLLVDLSEPLSTMDFEGAAEVARAAAEPEEDIHATVEYRRHLIGVLTERAARSALEHARTGSPHA